jgi:hypothetical protein
MRDLPRESGKSLVVGFDPQRTFGLLHSAVDQLEGLHTLRQRARSSGIVRAEREVLGSRTYVSQAADATANERAVEPRRVEQMRGVSRTAEVTGEVAQGSVCTRRRQLNACIVAPP